MNAGWFVVAAYALATVLFAVIAVLLDVLDATWWPVAVAAVGWALITVGEIGFIILGGRWVRFPPRTPSPHEWRAPDPWQ